MPLDGTRREFLSDVGRGVLTVAVGAELASALRFRGVLAEEAPRALSFGALEPLVCLMQETPADRLLPALAAELRAGTDLRKLTAAAALANARTFGAEGLPRLSHAHGVVASVSIICSGSCSGSRVQGQAVSWFRVRP